MSQEVGFCIEHPESRASIPRYLSYEGNVSYRKFAWRDGNTFALRFSRREDAEQVAAISRTLQPELWQAPVGQPRICEHLWD